LKKKKIFFYGIVRKAHEKLSFYQQTPGNAGIAGKRLRDFPGKTCGVCPAVAPHLTNRGGAFSGQTPGVSGTDTTGLSGTPACRCFRQPFRKDRCRGSRFVYYVKETDLQPFRKDRCRDRTGDWGVAVVVIPCPIITTISFSFSFFIYIRENFVQFLSRPAL